MSISQIQEPCDCSTVEEIVENHRTDLINFALHGNDFIRTLAIAAFLQAGGQAELEEVKRQIELVAEVSEKWD